jgi:hypothetical protein
VHIGWSLIPSLFLQICIQGPWEALHSGAVLVDAPGVRGTVAIIIKPPVHFLIFVSLDDNSARDAVVKAYLRETNSIWIVANIKRAVDDKTAKDMLGESFRRYLHCSYILYHV